MRKLEPEHVANSSRTGTPAVRSDHLFTAAVAAADIDLSRVYPLIKI
jgi:hypothetical protein